MPVEFYEDESHCNDSYSAISDNGYDQQNWQSQTATFQSMLPTQYSDAQRVVNLLMLLLLSLSYVVSENLCQRLVTVLRHSHLSPDRHTAQPCITVIRLV